MKEIEAISGIFLNGDTVLLLRRHQKRTFFPGKWDLMGGDIEPGDKPEDTLTKDAAHKLNIHHFSIEGRGEVVIDEGTTTPIRRHYFVINGDYSDLTVDSKKYDRFAFYDNEQIKDLELCPGVPVILKLGGFTR